MREVVLQDHPSFTARNLIIVIAIVLVFIAAWIISIAFGSEVGAVPGRQSPAYPPERGARSLLVGLAYWSGPEALTLRLCVLKFRERRMTCH